MSSNEFYLIVMSSPPSHSYLAEKAESLENVKFTVGLFRLPQEESAYGLDHVHYPVYAVTSQTTRVKFCLVCSFQVACLMES